MRKATKAKILAGAGIAILTLPACNPKLSSLAFFLKKNQKNQVEKVVLPCKIKDLQKEKDFLLKSGLKVEKWEILDDKGAEGAEIVLSDPNSGKKIGYSCIQTDNDMTECLGKVY